MPIYIGCALYDFSKLEMYKFYYDVVCDLWPKHELIASDTDSFFLNIFTDDVYEDMMKIKDDWLDTASYPKNNKLYSNDNNKRLGCVKDDKNVFS
jgi:hypothetical protein